MRSDAVHASRNCDPVNVIFPGKTWTQARDALLAKGWSTCCFGSTEYLHVGSSTTLVQNTKLFRGDGFAKRYHVRLWQTPGPNTVASVHHESGILSHTIDRDGTQPRRSSQGRAA